MKQLKEVLQKLLEEESSLSSINIQGDTLEDTLSKAAAKLGVPIADIDYEIEEMGNNGIFGIGKKEFKIKVYKTKNNDEILKDIYQVLSGSEKVEGEKEELPKDVDGEIFVKVTNRGVMMKVTAPIGAGKPITESRALEAIIDRGVSNFDKDTVKKCVKDAFGEYIKIGIMDPNPLADSTANVQISADEMKAHIVVIPPADNTGYDLDKETLISFLNMQGVKTGVKEDILDKIIDYPEYNVPILIAEGQKPKYGKDAEIIYSFNTNKDEIHLKESNDGSVDFKSLNLIQNVMAGDLLARKEPATKGELGRTVKGIFIDTKNGKDINLIPGKNVSLRNNDLEIVADINGQVFLHAGKVNVEEVCTISENVGIKTGHIVFLGTVIIQGDVEDGFNVKAAGNIEIQGSVGKCMLEAEGDVVISQGFMGKDEGVIISGKSVYAKFIENAKKIDAAEGVYVRDGIMNSYIDAVKEITCIGKRGTIVGGRLRAGELIKSKNIGSVASSSTQLEVGVDPKKRERWEELVKQREEASKELKAIQTNYATLEKMRKENRNVYSSIEDISFNGILKKISEEEKMVLITYYVPDANNKNYILNHDITAEQKQKVKDIMGHIGYLPPEKEEMYQKLEKQAENLQATIKISQEEIDEIDKYLNQLKSDAKIIGANIIYPGVRIYIKNAFLETKSEFKKNEFFLNGYEIDVRPFKDVIKEEGGKR